MPHSNKDDEYLTDYVKKYRDRNKVQGYRRFDLYGDHTFSNLHVNPREEQEEVEHLIPYYLDVDNIEHKEEI